MRELYQSGTKILAFKYSEGVIVAGDRRMTDGHHHIDDYAKVEDLKNLTLIACAGTVSCIQRLIQTLVSSREWLEDHMVGKPIFIDGQSVLLAKILQSSFLVGGSEMLWLNYIAIPILAGFDPKISKGRVFSYDVAGMVDERPNYVAAGSGKVNAETVLADQWNPLFCLEDARKLAIRSIMRASSDIHTSSPILIAPTIFHITKDGIGKLDERSALELGHALYYDDRKRQSLDELWHAKPDSSKEIR